MYPLLPFRPLATDIEHSVCELAQVKHGLGNAGRSESRAEQILVCRNVALIPNTVEVVTETVYRACVSNTNQGMISRRLGIMHSLVQVVM